MNLRPAMPGGKQVISKVPRMKRESPAMHVEKAKAGIKVQQESDQSVLDRMKRDANFHIEYFYPGVDDQRRMDVPMKDLAASIEPADPEHQDAPREGTFAKHSRQIDVREDAIEVARDIANDEARKATQTEEARKAFTKANDDARVKRQSERKNMIAKDEERKLQARAKRERVNIMRGALDAHDEAHPKPSYQLPKTPEEYNQPQHRRHRAVMAAAQVDYRVASEGGVLKDKKVYLDKSLAAAKARGARQAPLLLTHVKEEEVDASKPPPPSAAALHQSYLSHASHTDMEGYWNPPKTDPPKGNGEPSGPKVSEQKRIQMETKARLMEVKA